MLKKICLAGLVVMFLTAGVGSGVARGNMKSLRLKADKNDRRTNMTTIVVAASNSIQKDRADIVCDGTDDQIEIQAAIDSIPSGGGIVNLLDGQFNISMSIKPRKGCELIGEGKHTILYLVDSPNSLLASDAHKGQRNLVLADASEFRADMPITIVSSEYRTAMKIQSIKGNILTLDGKLGAKFTAKSESKVWAFFPIIDIDGADDVVIKNLAIYGNRSGQVFINATRHSPAFAGTWNYEGGCTAIYICGNSKNLIVENCYISNTQSSGIYVYPGGPNLTFINNRLEDIGDKGIVTVYVPGPGIISGNYISRTGKTPNYVGNGTFGYGDCINLHPPSGNGWIVTNNILKDALRSGIRMTGVSKSIAANNYVSDCKDCGIIAVEYDENTIIGNSVFRNWDGITLAFPSRKYGGTTVIGNIVSENRRNGIMFCGTRCGIIEGNSISKNGEHGIFITDKAYDIPVSEEGWPDKPKRGSGGYQSQLPSPSSRIIVSNNLVIGNSQKQHKTYDNIFVRGSSDILISGNICHRGVLKKTRYGINIVSSCSRVVVKGNNLRESGVTEDLHNEAPDTEIYPK